MEEFSRVGFRFFVIGIFCCVFSGLAGQPLTGTYTLPGTVNGQHIDNLTKLAALLNDTANIVNGTVIFEFGPAYDGTSEPNQVIFRTYKGSGDVIIRPSASATSGLLTVGRIYFNTQRFTFDGRPGGTGNTIGWTIQNSANSLPTISFELTHKVIVRYIRVESQNTVYNSGAVYLARGNRRLTISNNHITNYNTANGHTYVNGIYVTSLMAFPHDSIHILDNHISNFTPLQTSFASGIRVVGNRGVGGNWLISGNSLYLNVPESDPRSYIGIYFVGEATSNNLISNNYIGGNAPLAQGTWNTAAAVEISEHSSTFQGIRVEASGTQVDANVVRNINLTSTDSISFAGIEVRFDYGATITNNEISNIGNAGIGHTIGIYNTSESFVYIADNDIHSLHGTFATGARAKTIGIASVDGTATITGNKIYNLSSSGTLGRFYWYSADASAIGIYVHSGQLLRRTQTITNNLVHNIYNTLTTATPARVYGILACGSTYVDDYEIHANEVYNVYGTTTNTKIAITGIKTYGVFCNITNNAIRLGYRADGSVIREATLICGITDSSAIVGNDREVNMWHNSVLVGGTGVIGAGNSYAYYHPGLLYRRKTIYNNIFVNNRSNSNGSQTGKHYCMQVNSTDSVFSDYNILYGNGTGFNTSAIGTANHTLATWRTTSGNDGSSIAVDPRFVAPTAAVPNLHLNNTPSPSPADGIGTPNYTVAHDKDSLERNNYSPVDLGAYVVCASSAAITVRLGTNFTIICEGNPVVFVATTAPATAGVYEFYVNGVVAQTGTGNNYLTDTVAHGDKVWAVFTPATCAGVLTVVSDTITMHVDPVWEPEVTLTVSQQDVCQGTSVTFTAWPANVAPNPQITFYRNGAVVQSGTSTTYTTAIMANNDSVWVRLQSAAPCTLPPSVLSDTIKLLVRPVNQTMFTQTICFGENYLGYNTSGTHRDTFSNVSGCDSIRVIHLTVLPQNIVNLPQTICEGDTFVGYTATGIYTDTTIDNTGCDSITIIDLAVEALPTPPVITPNNNVLGVANTYHSYQWYLDGAPLNGETGATHTATADGNYTVAVANAAGCADTSGAFNVTGIGIGEWSDWNFRYYPNPTDGLLTMEIHGMAHADYVLQNSLGQSVLFGSVKQGGNNVLDMAALPGGVYYLRLSAGGQTATRKVLLLR